jgi:multicomponent Na+:H+ antiporter subunit E
MRIAGAAAVLATIYALVLASIDPWDLGFGALVATGLVIAFRGFVRTPRDTPRPIPLGRVLAFFPFLLGVLLLVLRGTWTMMATVLGVRPVTHPGIVEIPVGERTPSGTAVTAFVMTISPGSVVLDIDLERGVMLVHEIDIRDEARVRQQYDRFYERWQRRVFP